MPLTFATIDEITREGTLEFEELKQEEIIKKLEVLSYDCYIAAEAGPAQELFMFLQEHLKRYPALKEQTPAIFERYDKMMAYLQLAALDLLSVEELRTLLTTRLTAFMNLPDVDLRADFHRFFTLRNDGLYKGRDRNLIVRYFQDNEERLGEQVLVIPGTGETRSPTLGNWLKDYEQFFPTFTIRGSLERLRYMSEGVNSRRLSGDVRERLLRVLEIYDFVRFPSVALKEQGVEVLPSGAVPPRVYEPASERLSAAELMAKIENEVTISEARVRTETQGNVPKLIRAFYDNLFPLPGIRYDRTVVVGALVVLAKQGWLLRILEEPNPVREAFTKYLREEGKPEEAQTFKLAPTAPLSLGKFLRFVLQRRMRLPESDAAQIAVRIGNILKQAGKPEYFDMAYFDQSSTTFKWNG